MMAATPKDRLICVQAAIERVKQFKADSDDYDSALREFGGQWENVERMIADFVAPCRRCKGRGTIFRRDLKPPHYKEQYGEWPCVECGGKGYLVKILDAVMKQEVVEHA